MPETSGKEKTVYQIFQKIAGRYDRSNVLISLGLQGRWKKMLTGRLLKNLPEGAKVLDVCCGTGDIALELSRARRDLRVTGIDFSPAMLEEAEKRRRGRKNVRFLQGNAMALPFRDAVFDAAVISFGLRNTADYGRTLREMVRVVKEEGSVACLDSFVPGHETGAPLLPLLFPERDAASRRRTEAPEGIPMALSVDGVLPARGTAGPAVQRCRTGGCLLREPYVRRLRAGDWLQDAERFMSRVRSGSRMSALNC